MPGVFSENLNQTVKFLRRRENPMLYAATEMLMTRTDLYPCDKKGNILGASASVAAGIHPVPVTTPDLSLENIAKALGAPLEVVKAMAEGKTVSEIEADPSLAKQVEEVEAPAGISPAAEEVDTAGLEPTIDPDPLVDEPDHDLEETPFEFDPEANWNTYNRTNMCKWAVAKHGDLAATIDPEWSRKDIMTSIEMLEKPPTE